MSERRDASIADYVLGLMEPEDAARFEREMDGDADLAREIRDGRQILHPLDLTVRPLLAGDALWRRIETEIAAPAGSFVPTAGDARVAGTVFAERATPSGNRAPALNAASGSTPNTVPSPTFAPGARPRAAWASLWQSVGFWRPVGLVGTVASLVLTLGLATGFFTAPATPQFVAILVSEDGAAAGAIVEVSAAGEARLIPLRDIPVPEGRALEVWTLPSAERGPVSVGLIDRARSTDLALGTLPATHGDQLFEITLEPKTGSPVGRPTGPVLFKGLTARTL